VGGRTFPLVTIFGTVCGLLAQTFGGGVVAAGILALTTLIFVGKREEEKSGKAVMNLLRQLGREQHAAVIVVTHDERMIAGFDRIYHMTDGRITKGQGAARKKTEL
jgi:hypothetical protein